MKASSFWNVSSCGDPCWSYSTSWWWMRGRLSMCLKLASVRVKTQEYLSTSIKSSRASLVLSPSVLNVRESKLTSLEGHLAMIVLMFHGFHLEPQDIEALGSQNIFIHDSPLSFSSWYVELDDAWPTLNSSLNFSSLVGSPSYLKVFASS